MTDLQKDSRKPQLSTSLRRNLNLEKQFSTPQLRTVGLKQTPENNYPPRSEAVPTPPQRIRTLKLRLKCPQVKSTSRDSCSSPESKSSSSIPDSLKQEEENGFQSKGMLNSQPESQSPYLAKKLRSRRLSDRTIDFADKKSDTEELPEFITSPVSEMDMSFSGQGLHRTTASTNLIGQIGKLMQEPDSATSVSSNQDDESDMEKSCSPKPKIDPEMPKDDTFCQFAVEL